MFYLPLALALLLNGGIYYVALQHWFQIAHLALVVGAFVSLAAYATAIGRLAGIPRLRVTVIDWFFAAFLWVILASITFHGFLGKEAFLLYFSVFMLGPYVCARLLSEAGIGKLLRYTVLLGIVGLPFLVWEVILVAETYANSDRMVLFGRYFAPGVAGLLIGSLVVLAVALILRPGIRSLDKRALVVFTVIILPAIWVAVYMGARGPVVATLLIIFGLVAFAHWLKLAHRALLLSMLTACVLLAVQTLPEARIDLYKQMYTSTEEAGNSPMIRRSLYLDAIAMSTESPVHGVGAGNFGIYASSFQDYLGSPHSSLLHVLSELGIIGGLIFGGLIFATFMKLTRLYWGARVSLETRVIAWLLGALWAFYVVHDQFSGNYFSSMPFYLLTGCVATLTSGVKIKAMIARRANSWC
ncbi:MAG: O-antigen ligase family protein [Gammaproteobacteria bacterium]